MRACQHGVYLNKPRERGGGGGEMNWLGMHKGKALADKATSVLIIKNIQ